MATNDDLNSLGTKLDGLQLTDGERDVLHALINHALGDTDDVSGFATPTFATLLPRLRLTGGEDWIKNPTKPILNDDDW